MAAVDKLKPDECSKMERIVTTHGLSEKRRSWNKTTIYRKQTAKNLWRRTDKVRCEHEPWLAIDTGSDEIALLSHSLCAFLRNSLCLSVRLVARVVAIYKSHFRESMMKQVSDLVIGSDESGSSQAIHVQCGYIALRLRLSLQNEVFCR